MSNILANNINPRSGNKITIGNVNTTVAIAGTATYEDVTSIDSVGVITARSGVNVTGGSVGIGTDNPSRLLHVEGTGVQALIKSTNNNYVLEMIGNNHDHSVFLGCNNTNDFLLANESNDGTFAERLRITAAGELVSTNGTLRRNVSDSSFTISGDSASNTGANINLYGASHSSLANVFRVRTGSTERLRITSNGRFALGNATNNASPTATFQVKADDGEATDLYVGAFENLEATAGQSYGVNIRAGSNSTDHGFRVKNRANTDTQFLVRGDGKVGIGTDTPTTMLEVGNQSQAVAGAITISNGEAIGGGSGPLINLKHGPAGGTQRTHQIYSYVGDLRIVVDSNENMELWTGGSESLRIDSSGRVLIGTTTEGAANEADNLTIADSGDVGITLRSTNSGFNRLYFSDATSGTAEYAGYLLYKHADNSMIFGTNSTEQMRIDSSGRLLLDHSTAQTNVKFKNNAVNAYLQTFSSGSQYSGPSILSYSAADYNPVLTLGVSNSNTKGTNTLVGANWDLGMINFVGNDGTSFQSAAVIEAAANGTPASGDMPGLLRFAVSASGSTVPTERARIVAKGTSHFSNTGSFYGDYSGNTPNFFTVDSNLAQWTVGFRNSGSDPYGIRLKYNTDKHNSSNQFIYAGDSALKFAVYSNGGIANVSGNNSNLCDEREKKNIVGLESKWDKVKGWELKKFHYNLDADTDPLRYGVIAQQVEIENPELLTEWQKTEEVTRKGVKEQQMMWMAIKALQEAMAKIETLEAEVAALKGS